MASTCWRSSKWTSCRRLPMPLGTKHQRTKRGKYLFHCASSHVITAGKPPVLFLSAYPLLLRLSAHLHTNRKVKAIPVIVAHRINFCILHRRVLCNHTQPSTSDMRQILLFPRPTDNKYNLIEVNRCCEYILSAYIPSEYIFQCFE